MVQNRKKWPKTKIKGNSWSLGWTISNWTFAFAFASGCAVDHNECTTGTHDCASKGLCTNTNGSYTCSCPSGYKGNGIRRGLAIGNKVTGSGCGKCLTKPCVFVFFLFGTEATWSLEHSPPKVLLLRLQRLRVFVQNPKSLRPFWPAWVIGSKFFWKDVKEVERNRIYSCMSSRDDLEGFKGWKNALCFIEL